MDSRSRVQTVLLLLLILGMAVPCNAGEPTQQINQTTDKILSILSDSNLKQPSRAQERKDLISQAVDERFDWQEMAQRSLSRHWAQRTPEEKKEFVELFRDLLERTYLEKVDDYSGETVRYEGESVEGNFAIVKVRILSSKKNEIPVEYRLKKKGKQWLVYDISIEGVSLVNNYRTQFNSILVKSSYQDLVQKLKDKVSFTEKK